jgi:hypothetical protein
MGRREVNIEVFEDTIAFVDESENLQNAIMVTRKSQNLYLGIDNIPEPAKRYGQPAKVVVSGKRTLDAASAYRGRKTCILNFASFECFMMFLCL